MFRASQCSSSGDRNYINTSTGMISLCKCLLVMQVRRELISPLTGIPSSHLHRLSYQVMY